MTSLNYVPIKSTQTSTHINGKRSRNARWKAREGRRACGMLLIKIESMIEVDCVRCEEEMGKVPQKVMQNIQKHTLELGKKIETLQRTNAWRTKIEESLEQKNQGRTPNGVKPLAISLECGTLGEKRFHLASFTSGPLWNSSGAEPRPRRLDA